MATPGRRADPPLERQLFEEPYRFDFFQAVRLLERFLGLYVSINSFCQLVARTKQREGILKRWPPRAGERTLL